MVGRHIVLEVFLMLVSGVLRPEVTIVKMLDASVAALMLSYVG